MRPARSLRPVAFMLNVCGCVVMPMSPLSVNMRIVNASMPLTSPKSVKKSAVPRRSPGTTMGGTPVRPGPRPEGWPRTRPRAGE